MKRDAALRLIGEFAGDQWGMVTTAQASRLGIARVTLLRLVESGLLVPVVRGVYGIPAALGTPHETEKATWLRLDPAVPAWERRPLDADGGVVSHRSAAAVLGLGDLDVPTVDLAVPRRRTTRDPGVRLRTDRLAEADVTLVHGLPVTTAERTVVDLLADHEDGGHVGDVLAAALRRRLVDIADLDALGDRADRFAARYGSRSGRQLIDRLLDDVGYDRDRRLFSLARQLADLDTAQLDRLSIAMRELGSGEQR